VSPAVGAARNIYIDRDSPYCIDNLVGGPRRCIPLEADRGIPTAHPWCTACSFW
jgi:hypothetical protein